MLKERGLWLERGLMDCPTTAIDQAATQRVVAMLAEFLRQRGTFRTRKGACRKTLKHWATVFPSFIARENRGYDSRQRCLKP